ncbi:hypothetical protein MMC13_005818 [Lambiella insularis]|nr:hypothetical protein [Lambiella insularis]
MKFARAFEAALTNDDYPEHWVASAIAYKQLKKCIKGVQKELCDIGLEPDTLARLWKCSGTSTAAPIPLKYTFAGGRTDFKPKLVFVMDPRAELPITASLAPETKVLLRKLVSSKPGEKTGDAPRPAVEDIFANSSLLVSRTGSLFPSPGTVSTATAVGDTLLLKPHVITVEIPLMNDSNFFTVLTSNLFGLGVLRSKEEDDLSTAIGALGNRVSRLAEPSQHGRKTDLAAWRDIFALYTESNIFFSTKEQDQFSRTSSKAQVQFQLFLNKMNEIRLSRQLKKKGSLIALERFIGINLTLMKNLKFQELNTTAMTKILKSKYLRPQGFSSATITPTSEFDKRTALGARQTFTEIAASSPFSSASLAKAVCCQISGKILALIPQLNDYLCPVCFNVAWKPIRLQCSHIFCVRCMLVMQRSNNGHCPLCREAVIMQADSSMVPCFTKYFCGRLPNTRLSSKY